MSEGVSRFERIMGSIHVHTSFSGADLTPDETAELASSKGIKVLAITDYSDRSWKFHGVGINRSSVLRNGTESYFDAVTTLKRRLSGLVIVRGVEASPFCYWEGSLFRPVCREYNKHIVVLGFKDVSGLKDLPLVSNGKSGYNRYSGSCGLAPYQDLIDFANERGLLTFWAHPEMEDDFRFMNAVSYTAPYPDDLVNSSGYTGYSVLPRGSKIIPSPGRQWDRVLLEYCGNTRSKPAWCIGESDYRRQTDRIDNPATVFTAPVGCEEEALEALGKGQFYALDSSERGLFLNYFGASSKDGSSSASMGGTLTGAEGPVVINIDIEAKNPLKHVLVVKDGSVFKRSREVRLELTDRVSAPANSFYRIMVEDTRGSKLFSNPVFVRTVAG